MTKQNSIQNDVVIEKLLPEWKERISTVETSRKEYDKNRRLSVQDKMEIDLVKMGWNPESNNEENSKLAKG